MIDKFLINNRWGFFDDCVVGWILVFENFYYFFDFFWKGLRFVDIVFIFVCKYLVVVFVVFECWEEEMDVGVDLIIEGVVIFVKFFRFRICDYIFVREFKMLLIC